MAGRRCRTTNPWGSSSGKAALPYAGMRARTCRVPHRPRSALPQPTAKTVPMTSAAKALVLQGGGALGAYQAGVYEALIESDSKLDWVAGVSIGAINAALIAGNAPADRVRQLKAFWNEVSS